MPKGIYQFEKRKGLFTKGHKSATKGKHQTEEWKKKIGLANSIAQKGNKNGFKKGNIFGVRFQKRTSSEPYSVDWTKTLRRSIRERDHYICQICLGEGYSVHHIDYNKKNCNIDNLITLCHKCHTRTNFDRENWINYFYESK